jgi:two-component system CheB/CheR fusion protein
VLSGNGADGALGLAAIKAAGGLVIAQDPAQAGYDGMPRSAIATGLVDLVLPVEEIAAALARQSQLLTGKQSEGIGEIIAFLKSSALHDFTLYKPRTLERRIARRMALAGLEPQETQRYLAMLQIGGDEAQLLVEDLLINVTSFFRDPKSFEALAELAVPKLLAAAGAQPVRIWVAGCSTGEETYSLAMLFMEAIQDAKSSAKLQMFASDADAHAIAVAREGLYPFSVDLQVSAARLAMFFTREEHGYRVSANLRACIVFAVQDVLADPPFSRLHLISCRNLMIYLQPEAQAKIIAVFHFSLLDSGYLFLGGAETIGSPGGRFEVISKPARLYCKIPLSRAESAAFVPAVDPSRLVRPGARPPARGPAIAELYSRLVLERYAPPAVMVNQRLECLYSSGAIGAYLQVSPGYPTHDLLAQLAPSLRSRVKTAIAEAFATQTPGIVPGGWTVGGADRRRFNIDIQPVLADPDKCLLFFVVQVEPVVAGSAAPGPAPSSGHAAALERELATAQKDLRLALRSLELSTEEQNALNEEALSVNEEFQSTNEELLTSKEELQSLNEELTALNSQLQETLERNRTTLSDLQNVLYSSDVATLFLDPKLNIRFFTPAIKALFAIVPSDIGRPLVDFRARADDPALLEDAAAVLDTSQPIEGEVCTEAGIWFQRRIQPYRTPDGSVAGVVITFADITERRASRSALEAARADAERANLAKSRFLAAASHDLRQPLQALGLISALLGKTVRDNGGTELIARFDQALDGMAGMLNALLDINQIDAGAVEPKIKSFAVQELLTKLSAEFGYVATAQNLMLRVVACGLHISSDPVLLEQMLRNLLANAFKYTRQGGVLMGCRRAGSNLRIEVWDSGIGVPDGKFEEIFEEYRQVGNAARERSRGLGLGLAIVKRLSALLGHKVRVRSWLGRGSVFSIDVPVAAAAALPAPEGAAAAATSLAGTLLVIEDDPDIRHLLASFLEEEGHHVLTAPDAATALNMAATTAIGPDLIITDYNLPHQMNGVALAGALRAQLKRDVPVIIITGDISSATLSNIAAHHCLQLNKPMKLAELNSVIQRLLGAAPLRVVPHPPASTVFIVDDDAAVRALLGAIFEADGYRVRSFVSAESFLETPESYRNACLLIDSSLPGLSGCELLEQLAASGAKLPAIMITGHGDLKLAVRAMHAGALDFIEKPAVAEDLRFSVARAIDMANGALRPDAAVAAAVAQLASLTGRQREIMDMVLAGHPSKNIAADLGISQRTVETHRASIMAKTGARSIPALVRLAMAAVEKK